MPCLWSSLSPFNLSKALPARSRATPPPGRMPSSTAARVALHGVVDPILAFLHLHLRGPADTDHGNPARKLRQPLLQLLTVVVGGGLLDLRLDLGDTSLNIILLACTTYDRGVLFIDCHLLGTAKHIDRHVLKLDAEIRGDH